MMYIKIVQGKSSYTLETKVPEIYIVRKFSKMSTLPVNNLVVDVNPLVRF